MYYIYVSNVVFYAFKQTQKHTDMKILSLSSAIPLLPYVHAHKAGQEWTSIRDNCRT